MVVTLFRRLPDEDYYNKKPSMKKKSNNIFVQRLSTNEKSMWSGKVVEQKRKKGQGIEELQLAVAHTREFVQNWAAAKECYHVRCDRCCKEPVWAARSDRGNHHDVQVRQM